MKSKSAHQKLQEKSPLFFSIGLVLALLFVISAFEWKTIKIDPRVNFNEPRSKVIDITEITATIHSVPPRPKPATIDDHIKKSIEKVKPEEILSLKDFSSPNSEFNVDDLPNLDDEEAEVFTNYKNSDPSFVGGMDKFYAYLKENLQYPKDASKYGIDGKVYLSFIVDEQGKITNVKVVKGINEVLDNAAKKVLESSPNWTPGYRNGLPVKIRMQIPIVFSFETKY